MANRQVVLYRGGGDPTDRRLDLWAGWVLAAAIFLNPFLAFINAHLFGVTSTILVVGQLGVTLAAVGLLALRPPKVESHFFVALGLIFICWMISQLYHRDLDVKSLYDGILIPVFIMLGSSLNRFPLKMIYTIFGIVFAVALIEVFFSDIYIGIFNPSEYYRATREWASIASAGSGTDADLYRGANRAGGSWFSFLSSHRVGSIFLEPISLGYFALISGLLFSAIFRTNVRNYLIAAFFCLFLTLLADSRIPTILILLFTVVQLTRVQLPPFLAAMAMPAVMLIAFIAYSMSFDTLFSDTDARLGVTFDPLIEAGFSSIFGGIDGSNIGDSGVVYLIRSFGFVGSLIVFYLSCGFVGLSRWRVSQHVPMFVAVYATTALLFGGALFSIKTAALLGFFLGAAGTAQPMARAAAEATVRAAAGRMPRRSPRAAVRQNVRSSPR